MRRPPKGPGLGEVLSAILLLVVLGEVGRPWRGLPALEFAAMLFGIPTALALRWALKDGWW